MQPLVLASGSQYRAELLSRLGLEFRTLSPDIDETTYPDESHPQMVQRLAAQKADAVASKLLKSASSESGFAPIIIASDQLASLNGVTLGKPMTSARACEQLARISGETVTFLTALHMIDCSAGKHFQALDITHVTVRQLDADAIERYVAADQPLNCAGSFKAEALGISLFESISCEDPTALIGLPLISVCNGLQVFGLKIS